MAKAILMDEFHVTVYVPRGLTPEEYDAIRQALDESGFHVDLGRAVRAVIRQRPALTKIRITVTQ